MILLDQTIEENDDHDVYTVIAVLDEQARRNRRRNVIVEESDGSDERYVRLPPEQLVAPRWYASAWISEADDARVLWVQDFAVWTRGQWLLARPIDGWILGTTLAGIRHTEAEYRFDLRTGALRLVEAEENTWTNRRVYPSREDTRLFAAWLRQWLPDRSPIKNPKRSRR
jgi:hypothetical protein